MQIEADEIEQLRRAHMSQIEALKRQRDAAEKYAYSQGVQDEQQRKFITLLIGIVVGGGGVAFWWSFGTVIKALWQEHAA